MPTDNWLGRLLKRIRLGVVQDVPPGLDRCESCRELDCKQDRWARCANRLETEAAELGLSQDGTPPLKD